MDLIPYRSQRAPAQRRLNPAGSLAPSGPLPRVDKSATRRVGPGRLERGYQAQIARLQTAIEGLEHTHLVCEAELEIARLVERGTSRYVDRMESNRQSELAQSNRLLVLVGSLQQENERLLNQVSALESRLLRIASVPEKKSLLQRLGFAPIQRRRTMAGQSA